MQLNVISPAPPKPPTPHPPPKPPKMHMVLRFSTSPTPFSSFWNPEMYQMDPNGSQWVYHDLSMFIYMFIWKFKATPKTRMVWNEYLDHFDQPVRGRPTPSPSCSTWGISTIFSTWVIIGTFTWHAMAKGCQGMPWDAKGTQQTAQSWPGRCRIQSRLLLDRDGDHFVHILNLRNLYNLLHFRHHGHVHLFAGTGVPSLSI